MCMRVEFHHTKNGLSALLARSMKSSAAVVNSSSTVSMRFLVSGPVSLDLLRAVADSPSVCMHAARPELLPEVRILRSSRRSPAPPRR